MKRIHVILTRLDDQDMLTVNGPPFMCICAERFVVVDKRPAAGKRIVAPAGPIAVPSHMGKAR